MVAPNPQGLTKGGSLPGRNAGSARVPACNLPGVPPENFVRRDAERHTRGTRMLLADRSALPTISEIYLGICSELPDLNPPAPSALQSP